MRKLNKSYYIKKLDKVFSSYIRERAGKCEAEGKVGGRFAKCGGSLQCSHIKSVGAYKNLQFDPYNALSLCWVHHMKWWHKETGEAWEWFKKNYPDRHEYLEHNKNKLFHPTAQDLKELYEYCRQKVQEKII